MKTKKTRVLVLYNQVGKDEYEELRKVDPQSLGFKPEYPIHVSTIQEEYSAIVKGLRSEGFSARAVNVEEDVHKLEPLLHRNPPDVVFNLIEFFHDTPRLEGSVAGLFEVHRIPYTGAPPFALELCQRKGLTKQVLLANGVPTPRFRLLSHPSIPKRHGLHYPLIVKPAREDGSSGIDKESVVYDYAGLTARLGKVFAGFAPPIIVEEFIEGREFHVSILGNDPPVVLPLIEFDFSEFLPDHPNIISYAAKWDPLDESYHRMHSICPAKLPKRVQKRIEEIALRAYKLTGCRDYARLDLRLDKKNHAHILEVNPNPDLTEGVSFMESAEKAGLSFSTTLRKIAEFALQRKPVK
ncbi:MAG: ATP-grasp domain-containing protein [Bacteroidetes bacterium]|nr:ATP-grasp domain-containing protein [Bacteroidota bacterium]MCW5893988.1 ATP-grasp domain-containing protein [Bacteroidota bacterium]